MLDADPRRLGDLGMGDCQVLQIDRGDPFAARFDDVLGAVGDLHISVPVDRADVAGVEKTLRIEDLAALPLEIRLGDGGSAHLETAEGLPVPGPRARRSVPDRTLDAGTGVAPPHLAIEPNP